MSDLSEFIKKYGKPYDPDYNVPPFQENIDNASKSSAIYNMHMYWTKQDPYVVKRYIEHYTKPGDIVLDAFAGTGMTGVAAMMSGRHAILCEISPACIHIARNYTTPIDPRILQKAYYQLKEKIEPEIKPLYKTKCHKCGNSDAQIANTILSDVFRCPRCKSEVLFAGDGRWEKMKKGEKFLKIRCSHNQCRNEFTKAKAEFVRVEPVEIRVDCPECKVKGEAKAKPLDEADWELYISIEGGPTKVVHEGNDEWSGYRFEPIQRFLNDVGTKVHQRMLQKAGTGYIAPKEVPYWYPKNVIFFGQEPRRNLKRGITHPYQMFSRRNLISLSIVWRYMHQKEGGVDFLKIQIPQENPIFGREEDFIFSADVRDKLIFAFTGSLFLCCFMMRFKRSSDPAYHIGPAIRMGTLYIPSMIQDVNILQYFDERIRLLIKGLGSVRSTKPPPQLVIPYDAADLRGVSGNYLDYLFYDPPYGSNINYSELNLMWEAWLGKRTDITTEIIENEAQGKGRLEYENMMTKALCEGYQVLKPGRWLSIVYSYTDPSMYRTVQKMAHEAGFIDEGEVLHVNSARKTKSQIDSDKTQQRFLIINFKKPKNGERRTIEKSEDIEYDVIRVVQEFLTKHPGQTRDYIYDQVIKRLFTSVQIQKFDLDEILKNFFRKVGDEWYSPGSLVVRKNNIQPQGNLFERPLPESPEKEVVLQLQDFLKKHGKVPYSELREYYLRKIDIPIERSFDEIIKENLIIEQGRIRLPSVREQEQMQNVSFQYTKGTIKKFLVGNLKRTPSEEEICGWIEFCYQNAELDKNLYQEGWRLFGSLNEGGVPPERFKSVRKMAEVCKLRSE
ncbi:MAG: DNA methyltransferase [Thermodesulfobacteriota bacterium]|nr:DNA methyltransferase [Thermodesulfobacteriota bacterium]